MFYECNSLTSLNVFNFNTSKVTNMNSMFDGCTNLTSLILPNNFIPDDKSIILSYMFDRCEKLSKENVTTNDEKVKGMLHTK